MVRLHVTIQTQVAGHYSSIHGHVAGHSSLKGHNAGHNNGRIRMQAKVTTLLHSQHQSIRKSMNHLKHTQPETLVPTTSKTLS